MYGADEPESNESGGLIRPWCSGRRLYRPTSRRRSRAVAGGLARPQSEFVSPPPARARIGSSGGGRRAARPARREPVQPEPPAVEPLTRTGAAEPTRAERLQAMGRGTPGPSPTPAPPAPQEWDPDATAVAPPLRETPRLDAEYPAAGPRPSVEETALAPAPEWYRQDPHPAPPSPQVPDQQLARRPRASSTGTTLARPLSRPGLTRPTGPEGVRPHAMSCTRPVTRPIPPRGAAALRTQRADDESYDDYRPRVATRSRTRPTRTTSARSATSRGSACGRCSARPCSCWRCSSACSPSTPTAACGRTSAPSSLGGKPRRRPRRNRSTFS